MRRYTQKTALVTLSDINITPLLDLAFVLLIIFMITTPLMEQGLRLDLPKGKVADNAPEKRDLKLIEVDTSGEYFIDKQLISRVRSFRPSVDAICVFLRVRPCCGARSLPSSTVVGFLSPA